MYIIYVKGNIKKMAQNYNPIISKVLCTTAFKK